MIKLNPCGLVNLSSSNTIFFCYLSTKLLTKNRQEAFSEGVLAIILNIIIRELHPPAIMSYSSFVRMIHINPAPVIAPFNNAPRKKAHTDIMVIIKQIPQPNALAITQKILREKHLRNIGH